MTDTDQRSVQFTDFQKGLMAVLDEAFNHAGSPSIFLDPGDSLFPTLERVSAAQASIPVGTCGNSIAGQVAHLIFYFDVGFQYMRGENPGPQDWAAAWKTVEVTGQEWDELKRGLRARHEQLVGILTEGPPVINEDIVGGAFGMVAHTAFHLGQIRHALCMVGE